MASDTIGILLGVYNGTRFLETQIQSYLGQLHTEWLVLARNDGSTDNSGQILAQHAHNDSRFHILKNDGKNLGVIRNFSALMGAALDTDCRYFAFSDQDDFWHPEKLTRQIQCIQNAEKAFPGSPVLVHSDAMVADANLKKTAPSFMAYQGIQHKASAPLKNLLVQNFITGCTVMVNRRLLEFAYPVPDTVLMHDWWLALCAAAVGRIEFIDCPLIHYRQHETNQIGAKSIVRHLNPLTGGWFQLWNSGRQHLAQSVLQAEDLYRRMAEQNLMNRNFELIRAYASLLDLPPLQRIQLLIRLGITPQTLLRRGLMVSRLFFL
nr:glycosyltransferase family 2 protein [uncultured Desulfobacter sp.]